MVWRSCCFWLAYVFTVSCFCGGERTGGGVYFLLADRKVSCSRLLRTHS